MGGQHKHTFHIQYSIKNAFALLTFKQQQRYLRSSKHVHQFQLEPSTNQPSVRSVFLNCFLYILNLYTLYVAVLNILY